MKLIHLLPFLKAADPEMEEAQKAEETEDRSKVIAQLLVSERKIRDDLKQLVEFERRVLSDRRRRT